MQYHKYRLSDIENWIPWEREIYVAFLMQYLEEVKQRQQQQK